MSNPRDWRPDDDERPPQEWTRRNHEWSYGGNHRSSLPRWERHVRTFIQWSWVAVLVAVALAWALK